MRQNDVVGVVVVVVVVIVMVVLVGVVVVVVAVEGEMSEQRHDYDRNCTRQWLLPTCCCHDCC